MDMIEAAKNLFDEARGDGFTHEALLAQAAAMIAIAEQAKRIADAETGIESQPDLGLDRPLDRDEQLAEEARRRMARLRGEAAPAIGAATAVAAGARGDRGGAVKARNPRGR